MSESARQYDNESTTNNNTPLDENGQFSKMLYKTQLCKFGLKCRYQDQCTFAHKSSELRTPGSNAENLGWEQYKTKICHHFQNGFCKFGDTCTFLHINKHDLDRRLPIFKAITANTIIV
jgi:hypothetical protein